MFNKLKRLCKHRLLDESDTRKAIPPALVERLAQRVGASEKRHTGEIRVYVEAGLPTSYIWRGATPRDRALTVFGKLGVWDTDHNNGVLIYLLLAEHAIEIVADRGLNHRVDPQTWKQIVRGMGNAFKEGRFEDGLTRALEEVSALLVQHFPADPGASNPNELPDEPVLG